MKLIFMGTPEFAAAALEKIIEAGHQVALAVTQPDKPKGRGKELKFTPVKECALRHDIPVFQPEKIKTPEAADELKEYGADIFVVAAFGQILSEEILTMPKFGCVNIHASLLPKYRGADPIRQVILNGEKETGITIMKMDKGLDTGDILLQSRVKIDERETGDSLHDKLAAEGASLIVKALPLIEAGELTNIRQNEEEACYYAGMLKKSAGKIDFNKSAVSIERMVRAFNSWPGAYAYYNGKMLKIWESDTAEIKEPGNIAAGEVSRVESDAVYVRAADKDLKLIQVQLEGKKRMYVRDFLLGCKMKAGDRLE